MDIVERLRSIDISWSEHGEWCAEAANEIELLREALADLVAVQNGPPLVTYTEAWDAAMEKAYAALKEGE
jgi:hypothetical protein